MNPLLIIGVIVNSALYLTGCFVAGLVEHNPVAWRLALAAMGFTYLCYLTQIMGSEAYKTIAVTGASIALSFLAGVALLVL